MQEENTPKREEKIDTDRMHISHHLVGFFDLLARFDYEDRKKDEQALEVTAPSEVVTPGTCEGISKTESDNSTP